MSLRSAYTTSKPKVRHRSAKFQTQLRQISMTCQPNISHVLCQPYMSHMLVMFLTHVFHYSAHFSHSSTTSASYQIHVIYMSITCQPHLSYISATFQLHVSHISVSCQTQVKHMVMIYKPHLSNMVATCYP
jgi:hypothetical protein